MDTTICPPTRTSPQPIGADLLTRAHLVDATATGMEGLALWLATRQLDVTASIPHAEQDSPAAARLRTAGVKLAVGFDAEHVQADRTAVVWSGATGGPLPELGQGQALGLPVLTRALALSTLTGDCGEPLVAVYGSHDTATAAAALAAVLDDGRTSWILTAAARGGVPGQGLGGERLVVDLGPDAGTHEAASRSRLPHGPRPVHMASPVVALITTAAMNAPHFADTLEALDAATTLARSSGTVVLPLWDKGAKIVHERLSDRPGPAVVTVGLEENADVWVLPPRWLGTEYLLTLHHQGERHQFTVPVAGRHHALAVCAAIATALVVGEDSQAVAQRAGGFRGAERSLATLGVQAGVTVVDSRARHPREIAQDVTAARMLTEGSVVVVLEPDGVARTSAHAAEIGAALGDADHAVLLPVSTPLTEDTGPDPLDAVEQAALQKLGQAAVHRIHLGPDEPAPEQQIFEMTAEGDLVLVIGTGQAERLGPRLLFHLAAPAMPIPQQL
ncbi:glutamate ligase domain-containing protein [Kitasatospora sp. NPDC001309]|uniref:glutamate ligase domain-containing protein n=1 Tax=Kitasatospora sp. NPDC001309 TaxID=3364013 RepID=UPI00368B9B10